MKITISFILVFCLLAGTELLAQEVDLTGSWTICEMTWNMGDEVNTTTEEQMKAEGMTSEYHFKPEGKLTLVTNMAMGNPELQTIEGTWRLDADKLITGFERDGNLREITWDFEFKDGMFHLKRTSPDGSATVVNSFKRL